MGLLHEDFYGVIRAVITSACSLLLPAPRRGRKEVGDFRKIAVRRFRSQDCFCRTMVGPNFVLTPQLSAQKWQSRAHDRWFLPRDRPSTGKPLPPKIHWP